MNHKGGRIDFDDLNSDRSYEPREVYNRSKLCNVLFTRELDKRLRANENKNFEQVTVNALHPGVVKTELGRYFVESYGWKAVVYRVILAPVVWWMFKNSREGAQTSIFCAVDESLTNVSGNYFSDCCEKKLLPHALDDVAARRLWEMSEKMCGSLKLSP